MKLKQKKKLISIILISFLTSFFCGSNITTKAIENEKKPSKVNNPGEDYYPIKKEGAKLNKYLQDKSIPNNIENIVAFVEFGNGNYYDEKVIERADLSYNSQVENDNVTSLKEYLETISYGKQKVNSIWPMQDNKAFSYRPKNDKSYYTRLSEKNPNGYNDEVERFKRESELIKEVVENIQGKLPKDINLDQNSDSLVDMISFVFNINTESYQDTDNDIEYKDLLWPHMWKASSDIKLNGIVVGNYNFLATETKKTGIFGQESIRNSVLVHEFMHSLSMPDLYRYANGGLGGNPVGFYDIMASTYSSEAQRLNSYYQREYFKWGASIPEITESTDNVTISVPKFKDVNEKIAVKIKSKYSSGEYFIVEYRKREGLDKNMPGDPGLIVYRINESSSAGAGFGNSIAEPGSDFMYIYRPNEVVMNEGYGEFDCATLSSESGRIAMGKEIGTEKPGYDNETIFLSDGSNSGIQITNVGSNNGDTITFDVKVPKTEAGTEEDPFIIKNVDDIRIIINNPSAHFKLDSDIDFSNVENFEGIDVFNGVIDGNGKSIINLKMNSKEMVNGASFIKTIGENGIIKNLTFVNPIIEATNNAAVLSNYIAGKVENVKVLGGSVTSVEGNGAGIACETGESAVVSNSYTTADVKGYYNAAGLVSSVYNSNVYNCFALGDIKGSINETIVGQVFGQILVLPGQSHKIENVYWDLSKNPIGVGKYTTGHGSQPVEGIDLAGIIGVMIDKEVAIDLNKSDSLKINLKTTPANAKLNGTWSSDNKEIQVDNEGLVKANKAANGKVTFKLMVGTNYMEFATAIKVTDKKNEGGGSDPSNPGGDTNKKPDKENSKDKLPNTGNDTAPLIPLLGMVLIVAGCFMIYSEKFKKTM